MSNTEPEYTEQEKAIALRYIVENFPEADMQEIPVLMEIFLDGYKSYPKHN